jgi:class 3 adenylate cyclase
VPTPSVERKLAAIFAADVAGYSRLVAQAEVATLARPKACRAVIDQLIADHRGRIFNTAGDSVVADFASAVDAVQCAVAVQMPLADKRVGSAASEQMLFRIGIHVGDVLIDRTNLVGDGLNIAARLEELAAPGGICLSRAAFDQVEGKVDAVFADLGDQQFKNIVRPVRAYRVVLPSGQDPAVSGPIGGNNEAADQSFALAGALSTTVDRGQAYGDIYARALAKNDLERAKRTSEAHSNSVDRDAATSKIKRGS